MRATVLYKKNKPYVDKAGEAKLSRELHIVREDAVTDEGAEGNMVEKLFPKFDIGYIKVGQTYDFIFDMRSGYNGTYAVLVDIKA